MAATYAQLRAFHAVAIAGSFTAAAAAQRVSQPALTVQVRSLERDFGVELFFRRGRRVVLTPLGRELLGISTRLFETTGEADALLSAAGTLRRGALRIGADGPYHLMPLLAAFRTAHPGVTVQVTLGNSEVLHQALL